MSDRALQALGLPLCLRLPARQPCRRDAQEILALLCRVCTPPPGGTHQRHQQDDWLATEGRQQEHHGCAVQACCAALPEIYRSAQVAMTHPSAVQTCNLDLEALITDTNRTIATLAITTLLKTGNESSVERLLKQIGSFMSDIADDFKIVVVEAIRTLCLKFPQK